MVEARTVVRTYSCARESSPLQVSGAVTRLTVYRAAPHAAHSSKGFTCRGGDSFCKFYPRHEENGDTRPAIYRNFQVDF